jgi:uncharacterized membrane protein HdeD (DUF308 family)
MRSRRLAAARLRRTARLRRAIGAILILLGMLVFVIAFLSRVPLNAYLEVIVGGVLAVVGVFLITTAV